MGNTCCSTPMEEGLPYLAKDTTDGGQAASRWKVAHFTGVSPLSPTLQLHTRHFLHTAQAVLPGQALCLSGACRPDVIWQVARRIPADRLDLGLMR
jgi:hypothetical protein